MRPKSSIWLRIRRLGAIAALIAVTSLVATPSVFASAFARVPSPALQGVRASGMTLADAPRALQDAVLTTFAGPSQQTELTASDAADFGGSVGISGSTAVVGAPYTNSFIGAAYIFTESGGIWSQQAELTPSDPVVVDEFGSFVAVSGSTVVV